MPKLLNKCLNCGKWDSPRDLAFNNGVCSDCFVKGLSDRDKALLSDCPECHRSYAFAYSEMDADGICWVTCGNCELVVDYKIEFVND